MFVSSVGILGKMVTSVEAEWVASYNETKEEMQGREVSGTCPDLWRNKGRRRIAKETEKYLEEDASRIKI